MEPPKFIQIAATSVTDIETGQQIPVLFGLTKNGTVWEKIAKQDWHQVRMN